MKYDEKRKKAYAMLKKFGPDEPIFLKKVIGQEYNEETMMTEKIYEEYSGRGVYLHYDSESIGRNDNVIEAGDVKILCLLDDVSVSPKEDVDQIIFLGAEYNIKNVGKVAPDRKTVLLYKLQCKEV